MSEEPELPTSNGAPPSSERMPFVQYGSWPEPPAPLPRGRLLGLRRSVTIAAALGGLVLGSAVGGFLISRAVADDSLATAAAASSSGTATASPSPGAHFRGGFGGANGVPGVNLLQDAATTIGVTEQVLETDLQSGETIAQVAIAHDTTAQNVITALVGDATTAIDNLVSSGKITSNQASRMESNLTQMVTTFVNQTRPATAPSVNLGGSGEQAALKAAATTIGVSAATLESDLAAGQSVAEVASAHNVSAASVISAVTTAVDSQISSLESSGKLTSAQASTLTSEVSSRVTDWVDGTYPGWPFGPFGSSRGGSRGHWSGASPSPSPSAASS